MTKNIMRLLLAALSLIATQVFAADNVPGTIRWGLGNGWISNPPVVVDSDRDPEYIFHDAIFAWRTVAEIDSLFGTINGRPNVVVTVGRVDGRGGSKFGGDKGPAKHPDTAVHRIVLDIEDGPWTEEELKFTLSQAWGYTLGLGLNNDPQGLMNPKAGLIRIQDPGGRKVLDRPDYPSAEEIRQLGSLSYEDRFGQTQEYYRLVSKKERERLQNPEKL